MRTEKEEKAEEKADLRESREMVAKQCGAFMQGIRDAEFFVEALTEDIQRKTRKGAYTVKVSNAEQADRDLCEFVLAVSRNPNARHAAELAMAAIHAVREA